MTCYIVVWRDSVDKYELRGICVSEEDARMIRYNLIVENTDSIYEIYQFPVNQIQYELGNEVK